MDRRSFVAGAGALAAWSVATPAAEAQGAALLDEAFLFGFGPYEFARTGHRARQQGGVNTIRHVRRLSDHTSRAVTTPNNDTLYSQAWIDLSTGPVLIDVPECRDRYHSIALMSAFTDNFRIFGTRTTGGAAGRYLLAPTRWRGRAPEGTRPVRSPTNDVWLLGRTLVDGVADIEAASRVQDGIRVTPLTADGMGTPFAVAPTDVRDPANFLGVVNMLLTRSGPGSAHFARARRFRAAGIGVGVPFDPSLDAGWRAAIAEGLGSIRAGLAGLGRVVDGWSYPPPGVGDFGTNDALRARVALGGLAALPREEAMYFSASLDAAGATLNGDRSYRWRLPPGGVPAGAFWSLTMYQVESDGRLFLVDNPIARYAIGDRTPGLVRNADGSIDILLQHAAPASASNWLPAPAGPFRVTLRAYLPLPALLQGRWTAPAIEAV